MKNSTSLQSSIANTMSDNLSPNNLSSEAGSTISRNKNWLNRLKVGEKITIGYILSLGIAISGTAAGIFVGNSYQQAALDKKANARKEVKFLSQLQAGVLQSRTHQQQLIPLSEFPEDFKEEYNHILVHAKTIRNVWLDIEQHVQEEEDFGRPAQQSENKQIVEFIETYKDVDRRYLSELDQLVSNLNLEEIKTPEQLAAVQDQLLAFTNSDLAIKFDGISDELSGLIKEAQDDYDLAYREVTEAEALRNQLTVTSMALSVGLAVVLVLIISNAINRPLRMLEETAGKVIETENFALRTDVFTNDEVGSLAIALNQLIEWVGNRTQALENARDTLEKSVQERTQELNAIIDSLGNGLLVVNRQGTIVRTNPILKDLFDLPLDSQLENQAVQTFFAEHIVQLIQQSQRDPNSRLTDEFHLPNNKIGQAMVTAIVNEETVKKTVGTVVLIRDITTEKAVDQMKTDFISTVSHELRTPLTSVLGFAKIIQKKLDKVIFPAIASEEKSSEKKNIEENKTKRATKQVKENLKIIVSEGERLTALINDVLDIAKIEAGKIEWRMTEIYPAVILKQAISATRVLAQKNSITITADIPENLPTITGDQDRLVQVLINLISNAIKFTDQGSVLCEVKPTDDELYISVVDTGIGISPEDQPLVFEKFKQVGEIMTEKPKGTGLGLPICKQILEHHQGRIWVESQLNVGSRFTIALPLQSTEQDDKKQLTTVEAIVSQIKADIQKNVQKITAHRTEGTKTILVVDDEKNIRQLLRQELETEGYLVEEAADGVAALAKLKDSQPDLIITDVMMPRLDGFDLTAVLKANPQTADIPTIILSIVEDKDRGIRLGVDRYLTKPINVGELLNNVDSLLTDKTSRSKVLVVNRNPRERKKLADVLLQKGYIVAEATSGQEGLDKARSIKPDMVIVEAALSEEQDIVKTLRFEKGLEALSVILVESIEAEVLDAKVLDAKVIAPSNAGTENIGPASANTGDIEAARIQAARIEAEKHETENS